jgi:phospholipase/carboxylesterase
MAHRVTLGDREFLPLPEKADIQWILENRSFVTDNGTSRNPTLEVEKAFGYSNGANIAAALMLMRPEVLAAAILLRAMAPLSQAAPVDLTGKPILIVSGQSDPVIQPERAAQLASLLQRDGATVEHRILPTGHQLSQADVTLAREWLQAHGHPAMQ